MRYFAKQAATDTTFDYDTYRKTISIGSNGGFATIYWNVVTMKGGGGYDIILNGNAMIDAMVKGLSADATVSVDGGGSVIFNGVSTGDKFNISNKTYTLGNKKLK